MGKGFPYWEDGKIPTWKNPPLPPPPSRLPPHQIFISPPPPKVNPPTKQQFSSYHPIAIKTAFLVVVNAHVLFLF